MKLSIIIPVFNMEQYIEKCLDSVISQPSVPKDSYEVIVVNDGSNDSSQNIINSYEWKCVNHLLLQKDNGGLSSARNLGLSYAHGEYVWFVDSDDWIEEDCLNKIFPLLYNVDVLHFPQYFRETSRGVHINNCKAVGRTGPEITKGNYQYPVQFSIYNTNYLKQHNLSFQHGIVMEDLHFTPRALYKAKSLEIADFPVYHYLQREGSIMTEAVKPKRLEDRIWISHDLFKFMEENVLEVDKHRWSECIVTDVNAIMFDAFRSRNQEIIDMVHPYINKEINLTKWLRFSNNNRNRIWYYLSKLCFGNFYLVYKILYKVRYRNG